MKRLEYTDWYKKKLGQQLGNTWQFPIRGYRKNKSDKELYVNEKTGTLIFK